LEGRGLWIAATAPYPSLLVHTHTVIGVGGEERIASVDFGAMNLDLTRPWSFGMTVAYNGPAPGPGSERVCFVLIGDDFGPQNAVVIDINGTSGGNNHAYVSLVDDLGNTLDEVVPFTFGVPHLVEITWDGALHRAFVDGVQVNAGVLRNPSTITLKQTSADILGDAGAADWVIHSYQFAGKIPA